MEHDYPLARANDLYATSNLEVCLFRNIDINCVRMCACVQRYMHTPVCIVKLQNETRKCEIMTSQSFYILYIPTGSFGVLQNCVMCLRFK